MIRYFAGKIARAMSWAHNEVGIAHRNLTLDSVEIFDLGPAGPSIRLRDFSRATQERRLERATASKSGSARRDGAQGDAEGARRSTGPDADGAPDTFDTWAEDVWAYGVLLCRLLGDESIGASAEDGAARHDVAERQAMMEGIQRKILAARSGPANDATDADLNSVARLGENEKALYKFLIFVLNPDPAGRPSAKQVLEHPYLSAIKARNFARFNGHEQIIEIFQQSDVLKDLPGQADSVPHSDATPPTPPMDPFSTSIVHESVNPARSPVATDAMNTSQTGTTGPSIMGTTVVNATSRPESSVTGTSVMHDTAEKQTPIDLAALQLRTNTNAPNGTGQSSDAKFEAALPGLNQDDAPTLDMLANVLSGNGVTQPSETGESDNLAAREHTKSVLDLGSNLDTATPKRSQIKRPKKVSGDLATQSQSQERATANSALMKTPAMGEKRKGRPASEPPKKSVKRLLPSSLAQNVARTPEKVRPRSNALQEVPRGSGSAPGTPASNTKARSRSGETPRSAQRVHPSPSSNPRKSQPLARVTSGEYDNLSGSESTSSDVPRGSGPLFAFFSPPRSISPLDKSRAEQEFEAEKQRARARSKAGTPTEDDGALRPEESTLANKIGRKITGKAGGQIKRKKTQ